MQFLTTVFALLAASSLALAAPQGLTPLLRPPPPPVSLNQRIRLTDTNAALFAPPPRTESRALTLDNRFAETAFASAKLRKIDPAGPMPRDFTSDNGQWIDFPANSNFALWAAAQNARTDKKALIGNAGLNIV